MKYNLEDMGIYKIGSIKENGWKDYPSHVSTKEIWFVY
jgi:hypothetical protein